MGGSSQSKNLKQSKVNPSMQYKQANGSTGKFGSDKVSIFGEGEGDIKDPGTLKMLRK